MTKISNATPGPRGLHTKTGLVWVEGYSTVDAEFENDKQIQSAIDTGWFVRGERKAPGGDDASEVDALKAEIERLKALVPTAPLKAEHHGGGKFNITQGETVLSSGLSKADADAFNALSDAEKAEFIKAKA